MTRKELPALGANLKRVVGSSTTCTPATVDSLKSYLLSADTFAPLKNGIVPVSSRPKAKGQQAQAISGAASKQKRRLEVTSRERSHDENSTVQFQEKYTLATEVVNATLKALTEAIKAPPAKKVDQTKSLVKSISSSNIINASEHRSSTPLQPICANLVSNLSEETSRSRRSSSAISPTHLVGLRSQAECARVAFAALRSILSQKIVGISMPYLQLENGMSALVGKLMALGFEDLAVKELRVLKRRIDHSIDCLSTNEDFESTLLLKTLKSKHTSMKELSRASLLFFPNTTAKGPLLALMVAFQLHVLKLIASRPTHTEVEAAFKHIQLSVPYSPVNLIQCQMDTSPESRVKVSRQLELLAQSTMRLCYVRSASSDEQIAATNNPLFAHTAFKIQILVLEIRYKWREIRCHQFDPLTEIVEPFARYLSNFRRLSEMDPEDTYETAKTAFTSLSAHAKVSEAIKSSTSESRENPLLAVYQSLANLAQECCSFDEAVQWLQCSTELLRNVLSSPTRLCTLTCRVASLRLRTFIKGETSEHLLSSLEDAIESLKGDLRGESLELEDLLSVVATLRRLAFSVLQDHYKSPDKCKAEDSFEAAVQCSKLIILGVNFLIRLLGSSSAKKDFKASARYEQRKKLVWNNTGPFFESVAAMARFSIATGLEDWERLDAGLQECVRLASALGDLEFDDFSDSTAQGLKEFNLVSLSNAYWYHYQYLKQKGGSSKEIRRSLQLSIEILKNRPCSEKLAGDLPSKLEKFGSICEASKEFTMAASIYSEALQLQVDGGLLKLAAEAAATRPLVEVLGHNGSQYILGRILLAYQRVTLEMDNQISDNKYVYDVLNLSHSERGILLEQQLSVFTSALHIKSRLGRFTELLQSLIKVIFTVYTESEFPIRRLRVGLQLLRLHFTHPTVIQPEVIEQVLHSEPLILTSVCLGYDTGLSSFSSHLLDSWALYSYLYKASFDTDAMTKLLTSWSKLLRECNDFVLLQKRVDDISHWILQLESFAEYLDAHGLELQRVTVLHLLTDIQEVMTHVEPPAIASAYSALGLQYARLGYSNQAGQALQKASKYLLESENFGQVKVKWNLASAEYALGMGNIIQAEAHLAEAHNIFKMRTEVGKAWASTFRERSQFAPMLADANYAHSLTAAAKGKISDALLFARQNVKLNYRAWAAVEPREGKERTASDTDTFESDIDVIADQTSKLSLANSQVSPSLSTTHAPHQAAALWSLVPRLFYGLTHLSQLFAHEGLFPQARYYIEQGQKIVNAVQSLSLRARSMALLGSYLTHNGEIDKGLDMLRQAEAAAVVLQSDHHVASLNMFLADNHALHRDTNSETDASRSAERILEHLMKRSFIEGLNLQSTLEHSLEVKMDQLTLSEAQPIKRPQTNRRVPAKRSVVKPAAKSKPSSAEQDTSCMADALLLFQIKGKALRQRAFAALRANKLDLAASLLSEAMDIPNMPEDRLVLAMVKTHLFLRRAQESMTLNPVFCVLSDSTISYPSLTRDHQKRANENDRISPSRKSPLKVSVRKQKQAQTSQPSEFVELLNQAQESLISICTVAKSACSTAAIHSMTDVLAKTMMMLSAVTLSQPKSTMNPLFTLYAMELGRTVSSLRETLVIQVERKLLNRQELVHWPREHITEGGESLTAKHLLDFGTFQAKYIDIIPFNWTVLSLSLSNSQDEIRIAKIRSDQTPFIITLPLNRHKSRDPDAEFFGFKNGKDELQEIIELANYSAHDAKNMARKGANSEWWEVREALDMRLKELLFNIENIWLGGFRGIFSDSRQPSHLLSRFQQSLQKILKKHLPSRRRPERKKKSTVLKSSVPEFSVPVFDPHVLELFIGLGLPTESNDMEESLMDLLYYIIDILQFHGERNAYDEIEFDSIAIEVIDALRQYHEVAKNEVHEVENNHTILILDKTLHSFPWESLPCMDHHAVSRLPSLACLRERIIRQNDLRRENGSLPIGQDLCVDRSHGASILNPAGDLKATQATFEQPLQELSGWTIVTEREPTEDEMKSCLETHDIFLYLGHGSGSQYIRSRTIRNLEHCAIALLMGCSSGVLTEAGDFEPFGTPMNYIRAGCPALLANLWDVTDKDIDRFSYTVLESWGLFHKSEASLPRSPVKRGGRGRTKKQTSNIKIDRVSLDEAVAKGRGSCRLRYLNGAAPVIYGVPVFLS